MAAKECYLDMLAIDEQLPIMSIQEKKTIIEPIKVLEDVQLDETSPEKFTRIGTSLEEKTKQDLVEFLKRSKDVFAWSHENMPRIDPSVITHHLNVAPSYKLVHQKEKTVCPRVRQCH